MMIGYTRTAKIWRLWDLDGNCGVGLPFHSSNVIFLENAYALVTEPEEQDQVGSARDPFDGTDMGLVELYPALSASASVPDLRELFSTGSESLPMLSDKS
jgi:hypothetical protein